MANDISNLVWVIDTASATPITVALTMLDRVRWVSSGASAGDAVVIKDNSSTPRVIFETRATGANYVEESLALKGQRLNGVAITTLTSGKLYLYHRTEG